MDPKEESLYAGDYPQNSIFVEMVCETTGGSPEKEDAAALKKKIDTRKQCEPLALDFNTAGRCVESNASGTAKTSICAAKTILEERFASHHNTERSKDPLTKIFPERKGLVNHIHDCSQRWFAENVLPEVIVWGCGNSKAAPEKAGGIVRIGTLVNEGIWLFDTRENWKIMWMLDVTLHR